MNNKLDLNKIYNMDCLKGMAFIPDKSIDCIIVDLPYAITANKWDLIIPMHDYVVVGKKEYNHEEYLQYAYAHNTPYKEAVEYFNNNKKFGLWSHWKRIIKDDGVIVLFGNEPFTSFLIRSNTEMYRYSWVWKKEGPTGFLNSKYRPLQITEDIAVFSKAKVGSLSKLPIIYHPPGLTEVNIKKAK